MKSERSSERIALSGWPLRKNNLLVAFILAGVSFLFLNSIFIAYSARRVDELPKPQFNESHSQSFRQSIETGNAFAHTTMHIIPYAFAIFGFIWLWSFLESKAGFFLGLGAAGAMLGVYFCRAWLPRQTDDFFAAPSPWFNHTSIFWFTGLFLFWFGVISAWNSMKPHKQLRSRTKLPFTYSP